MFKIFLNYIHQHKTQKKYILNDRFEDNPILNAQSGNPGGHVHHNKTEYFLCDFTCL